MRPRLPTLGEQFKAHSVALISLVLAILSLAYTTWRNETTETQRNVRTAAFRSLESLAELQIIVDARQFEGDRSRGDYISGWARVLLVEDMSRLLPPPGPEAAGELRQVWQANFSGWYAGSDSEAERAISAAIRDTRDVVLAVLARLE